MKTSLARCWFTIPVFQQALNITATLFLLLLSAGILSRPDCQAAPLQDTEFVSGTGWTCYGTSCPPKYGGNWESCVADGRTVAKIAPDQADGLIQGIYQSADYADYGINPNDSVRATIQWLDRSGTNSHKDCETRLGLDPNGDSDSNAVTHWTPWTNRPCSPWQTMSIEAMRNPGADRFTVFIETRSRTSSYATGIVDWVAIERVPGSSTPLPTITPVSQPTSTPAGQPTPTPDQTDFTFLIWSDPHFDAFNGYNQRNNCVGDMNTIAGKAYPPSVGGVVDTPAFVIVTGDIGDNGLDRQYYNTDSDANNDFLSCVEQLLYPYYMCRGNHDIAMNYCSDYVMARSGELYYSFDYQGVHFVVLDTVGVKPELAPEMIAWLQSDLVRLTPETPIIPCFHYDPEEDADWEALRITLAGYNVPVILHGHQHNIHKGTWRGYDVYATGQNKQEGAGSEGFLVVHVTNTSLTCVSYDWQRNQWYTDPAFILQKAITGLPRANNPPAPTPTPPNCVGTNLLANGNMETFTGNQPNQVASGWTSVNLDNSSFRRSPGWRGQGYGQTMERDNNNMDHGEGFIYQKVSVIPGHAYRLTAWGRPENGGDGSPPEGSAPDTALCYYGIGLDPSGGTVFGSLASQNKVVRNTGETGYTNLAYHRIELEVVATGNHLTAFLYYLQPSWKYRPPRVIWDHVCLTDMSVAPPTPTPFAQYMMTW